MKRLFALLVVGLLSTQAAAQTTWYLRGDFNGWSTDNPMTDLGSGNYQAQITGLFANVSQQFKVATADWVTAYPGNNAQLYTDASGNLTVNFFNNTTWTDGWLPNNTARVGYVDPQLFGWEIVGSFNNWPGTFDPAYKLNSLGNGLYSGQFALNAGIYDYKFRGLVDQSTAPANGVWNTSIGNSFGNTSGNNTIAVQNNGDLWQFDLDLPNGRFRAFSVDQHGDFNGDGSTNAADYVVWRNNMPGNSAKYTEWRSNFGRSANLSWLAHGTFGADVALTSQGNGNYSTTLSGLTAGTNYDVQILRSDASSQYPGSSAKIAADASGNINLHFKELSGATWADGWSPTNVNRFGYDDPHQFGWEVVGSFNGWPGAADPLYALTDQGNGLYTGSFAMPTAGTYAFKFRKQGSWDISIGNDFGNSASDNAFTVAANGDVWNFELDLPNGRWRAYHPSAGLGAGAVPEPSTIALMMVGLAFGFGRVRRK